LRFFFAHGQWIEKVRVVNFSNASQWDFNWFPYAEMKSNIALDLNRNDRLYVASAGNGNPGGNVNRYPAALSNVLGVTGALASYVQDPVTHLWSWSFTPHPGSNYHNDTTTYQVSGIYGFASTAFTEYAAKTPGSLKAGDSYEDGQPSGDVYGPLGGTSECAAQVSALAALLYDKKWRDTGNDLASSYTAVEAQITGTRSPNMVQSSPYKLLPGVINIQGALSTW
jgi:hypothetical protein